MSIFDKIFGIKKKEEEHPEALTDKEQLPSDQLFVNKFKEKGGKFLYTEDSSEILVFLKKIISENAWEDVRCTDTELLQKLNVAGIAVNSEAKVYFSKCEFLITDEGSILFSSKQLGEEKLSTFPLNFIVYATTSQFIKNKDQALSNIKHRYASDIPTNISAIKGYTPENIDTNFLSYGNNNSKNLYLLLFEDL